MKIALLQVNPTVGDVDGNVRLVQEWVGKAAAAGADLAIFPEQTLLGYPAKDLLLRDEVVQRNVAALHRLAQQSGPTGLVVGFAEPNNGPRGRPVFNSAALLRAGKVKAVWRKRLLPTYDVFDEARYFEPGGVQQVVDLEGIRLGMTICEDLLSEPLLGRTLYSSDPVQEAAQAGAELILNISASPYRVGKHRWRLERIAAQALRRGVMIAYVNQVGGNDELLFDGASCAVDAQGRLAGQAAAFREDMLLIDTANLPSARREELPSGSGELFEALVMGLRDYFRKCGFRRAVLGLSGGIDSAVVACIAAEALGPHNVHAIAMPSRHSSAASVSDARELAGNLGLSFSIIPIELAHQAFEQMLAEEFRGDPQDETEENIQARVRGVTLMALSNKTGALLLTTGNKSELALGYCTLYGDMAGGLAVISDVPKTAIYGLARYVNERAGRWLIPESTLTKPPSAELRPNQKDTDTLPPYEIVDAVLELYEEKLQSAEQIIAAGFDAATVHKLVRMMNRSEYKRRQAAPGLKVTSRAFGFGRRMPIAAKLPE